MDRIRKNLYLILGAIVIAGAVYLAANPPKAPVTPAPTTQTQTQAPQSFSVVEVITYGDTKPTETLPQTVTPGQTAMDLLGKTKTIETKEYSFGKSVESIEGIKNGTAGKYWLYYINDQQAPVGADTYELKPNDKIEWKFEKSG